MAAEPAPVPVQPTRRSTPTLVSVLLWAYNLIAVPVMYLGSRVVQLVHPKVRSAIQGRRPLWQELDSAIRSWPSTSIRLWLHASSMGELEQARPVVKALRHRLPDAVIVVTLFSPSARRHIRDIPGADLVSYLPFDTWRNARRFVATVAPDAVLFVRYDLWPNHLVQARRRGAITLLVDASVRRAGVLGNPILRSLNRAALSLFDRVASISEAEAAKLRCLGVENEHLVVCGDTRYDQVAARASEPRPEARTLSRALGGRWVVVAGSTWPSDEEQLLPAFRLLHDLDSAAVLLVAPHEPSPDRIRSLGKRLEHLGLGWCSLSQLPAQPGAAVDAVIVDSVGVLANLYGLGRVAFVGGGFGPGVHSVLEPAAHGVPVLFGPRHANSAEAAELVKRGCAARVDSAEHICRLLRDYREHEGTRDHHGRLAREFVEARLGGSDRIADLTVDLLKSVAAPPEP